MRRSVEMLLVVLLVSGCASAPKYECVNCDESPYKGAPAPIHECIYAHEIKDGSAPTWKPCRKPEDDFMVIKIPFDGEINK